MVRALLVDIEERCKAYPIEVLLTLNLSEELGFTADSFTFPIKIIRNLEPKGFSTNHNQAFVKSTGQFFCVMNPDIRLIDDPFRALLTCLDDAGAGVAAPLVLREDGAIEDSARRFPTPLTILCKALGKCKDSDYLIEEKPIQPDWAAGMFLLFPRAVFERLGGFDQRYFLYYEDVDICARLRLLGYAVVLCPQAKVIHHARRTSHRSVRYLRWHLTSMLRFFLSPVYWRLHCLAQS